MLELMQGNTGGIRPTYPNSGPGIKTLMYGDEDIGYFGEVSATDLFTPTEFITLTKAYFGIRDTGADSVSPLWLKFFHKGKIIYIAKYPFIYAASWEDMYKAGLVYGTQDNGKYPVAGAETWQYNPLSKTESGKDWTLIPRMMKGLASDPYSTIDPTTYVGSEYTELLGRVADVTNTPVNEKWAKFPFTALGLEQGGALRYTALMESQASNPYVNALYGGSGSAVNYFSRGAANKTTANLAYRPVLQLANPSDGLIPVTDATIDSTGLAQIVMKEYVQAASTEFTQRATDIVVADAISKELLPVYSIDAGTAFVMENISANDDNNQWASFTISGSYTA